MWWHWQGAYPDPMIVNFMKKNYPPDWTYADFATQFRAELFSEKKSFDNRKLFLLLPDPSDWADIFAASGAKYVRYIFYYVYDCLSI